MADRSPSSRGLLAALLLPASAWAGSFPDTAVRLPYPEGMGSRLLALSAADFDGDGRTDLAGPMYWSGACLLRRGEAGWDWKRLEIVDNDQEIAATAAADLDGDGLPDLVVRIESGLLVVFRGSREEGLVPAVSPLGEEGRARCFAAGDLDGDGLGDIAAAVRRPGSPDPYAVTLDIFLGRPGGDYLALTPAPLDGFPDALVAGDFDGDGRIDLAISGTSSGDPGDGFLRILGGNGAGCFLPFPPVDAGGPSTGLRAGDVDGDGKPDLLVWSGPANAVRILLGKGGGGFAGAEPVFAFHPIEAAAADLDGDGRQEVLVHGGDESLEVHRFRAGALRLEGRWLAGGRLALPPADLDGDGRPDLALHDDKGLAILRGDGTGRFAAPPAVATWSREAVEAAAFLAFHHGSLAVADVGGDGIPDLLWIRMGIASTELAVAAGLGDGTFGDPRGMRIAAAGTSTLSPFALADLDGDGRQDAVVGDYGIDFPETPGALRIFPGNGDGTFREGAVLEAGLHPFALAVGLLDDDSIPDVAVDDWKGSLILFRGNGDGTLRPWTTFPVAAGLSLPVLADLDGDGATDLAFTSPGAGSLDVLFGDISGGFERKAFLPADTGFSFGYPVLAAASWAGLPALVIPEGSGIGRFSLPGRELRRDSVLVPRQSWLEAGVMADLDGDGTGELLLGGHEDLEAWAPGDLAPRLVSPAPSGSRAVAAADLDGDGRLDVVTMGPSIAVHLAGGRRSASFIRGDARPDGGIDLSDAIAILEHFFLGAADPTGGCPAAMDANADGALDLSDPIGLLLYLYLGGAAPAGPFPGCGADPDPRMGCATTAACR